MFQSNPYTMHSALTIPNYENDIFVSYRRPNDDWVRWTKDIFVRILESVLCIGIDGVRVYMDESIDAGADWPDHLALNLSRSKIMIAILSRSYFSSSWCRLEFSHMHRREVLTNFRTAANPCGLIIPVVIDDGICFPEAVQKMQLERLDNFANPFICAGSPKQEALADIIRERLAPVIERTLASAPIFDPAWGQIAHREFEDMFRIHTQAQKTVPSLVYPQSS
jgi:hypothetical protein